MSREYGIPLVMWISTAILAHIASFGGAEVLAKVVEDRVDLQAFARDVRSRVSPAAPIEISFQNLAPVPSPAPSPLLVTSIPPPKKTPVRPKEPKKEEPKPRPEIVLPKMAASAAPPAPPAPPVTLPEPKIDRRIAVRQHVEPNQEDNPTAKFIGDEANRVAEETVARITAHDQDDPHPTPGGSHAAPDKEMGNSDKTRIADSDEQKGEQKRAPGESGRSNEPDRAAAPAPPEAVARGGGAAPPSLPSQPASSPPEPVADGDGYSLDPLRPKTPDSPVEQKPDQRPHAPAIQTLALDGPALPNGINLNLTQRGVVAAVGTDQLAKERVADGERRKSTHRGSWQTSGFERWRPAIENYVSTVKPGNQTALNTARVPFATYLNSMHNRIHPIFAEDFLSTLDGLPSGHPLSNDKMFARLEIVLDPGDGRVTKMGVVKTSGVTAFDIAALDSVQRASPFGKPPTAIVSGDGHVYLHWEFHRDPIYACSTAGAQPYMLPEPPEKAPSSPKSAPPLLPPSDPRERGDRIDPRHGLRPAARARPGETPS
jgi:TonB family protein